MITCDYIGRMGNQMFQIAATVSTAWRNGTDFAFPTRSAGSYTGEVYFKHLPKAQPGRLFPVHKEVGHFYTPIPTHLKNAKLHGYWQSEKYFKEYRKEIIELLKIPYSRIEKTCSIHIRLGDYKTFSDKHPVITDDYLDTAIKHICEKTGISRFMVFSDDIFEARKMIEYRLYYGCEFIYVEGNDPLKDMELMSGCEHNICANSTFSWWGSWLNQNPDKIVIMPKQWFGPGNSHLETKDIYPEGCIII